MTCPLGKPLIYCLYYGKELLCDYPYSKEMAMAEIKDTTERLLNWKFKCLDCGYSFRGIEPQALIDNYQECSMCGGKHFVKKVRDEAK